MNSSGYANNPEKSLMLNQFYWNQKPLSKFVETFMVNTMIFLDSSSTEGFRQNLTTYFQVTTQTEESSRLKPSLFCQPIKSDTQKISFYLEEITSVVLSTGCMVFMTIVNRGIVLNCGKPSQMYLNVFQLQPLLMKRYFVLMVDSAQISRLQNRFTKPLDLWKFQTKE